MPNSNAPEFDPLNATREQEDEMCAGYSAGFGGRPMIDLASMPWEHGYRNGRSDRSGFTDHDQKELAKRYAESQRVVRRA